MLNELRKSIHVRSSFSTKKHLCFVDVGLHRSCFAPSLSYHPSHHYLHCLSRLHARSMSLLRFRSFWMFPERLSCSFRTLAFCRLTLAHSERFSNRVDKVVLISIHRRSSQVSLLSGSIKQHCLSQSQT